jgi:hypothetical protein
MKETTLIAGILQIDHERGVIYFHSSKEAMQIQHYCPTPLRICGLGKINAPLQDRQIDITIRDGRALVQQ